MKNVIKIAAIVFILFAAAGCSSSKKGSCGCPNKQGLTGYN